MSNRCCILHRGKQIAPCRRPVIAPCTAPYSAPDRLLFKIKFILIIDHSKFWRADGQQGDILPSHSSQHSAVQLQHTNYVWRHTDMQWAEVCMQRSLALRRCAVTGHAVTVSDDDIAIAACSYDGFVSCTVFVWWKRLLLSVSPQSVGSRWLQTASALTLELTINFALETRTNYYLNFAAALFYCTSLVTISAGEITEIHC